MMIGLIAGDVC